MHAAGTGVLLALVEISGVFWVDPVGWVLLAVFHHLLAGHVQEQVLGHRHALSAHGRVALEVKYSTTYIH